MHCNVKGLIMSKDNQLFKQNILITIVTWAFTDTKRNEPKPNQTTLDNIVDNLVYISIVVQKAILRWFIIGFIANHSAHFLGIDLKSWVDSMLDFLSLWK